MGIGDTVIYNFAKDAAAVKLLYVVPCKNNSFCTELFYEYESITGTYYSSEPSALDSYKDWSRVFGEVSWKY